MDGYRIELTPDDDGSLMVTCPDLPEVTTYGETREEALRQAGLAIEEALAARMDAHEPIPAPTAQPGPEETAVALPLWTEAKVGLHRALRAKGITRAELGRRMGVHRPQIDRLFRLDHVSKPDQVEAAFAALGYSVRLQIEEAA